MGLGQSGVLRAGMRVGESRRGAWMEARLRTDGGLLFAHTLCTSPPAPTPSANPRAYMHARAGDYMASLARVHCQQRGWLPASA